MFDPKYLVFLVPALSVGCANPTWNRKVERWGSLKEVLRNGQTEGRVKVSQFTQQAGTVGLGVLKELKGEVTMVGGKVWVSTVKDGKVVTEAATVESDGEAAFLVASNVTAWRDVTIDETINLEGLQEFIESNLSKTELAAAKTIPFVVRGSFDELNAHVVNGGCPFAADEALRKEPVREKRGKVNGTLIGFITSLPPGTLT
ncbi:MAG: acetolactate decarboxylase, partial [Planctomycetota bacterium]|nr:acetolactate decarboxylase [Planctomycetota bacterium]